MAANLDAMKAEQSVYPLDQPAVGKLAAFSAASMVALTAAL